jgi:hypothetical protein
VSSNRDIKHAESFPRNVSLLKNVLQKQNMCSKNTELDKLLVNILIVVPAPHHEAVWEWRYISTNS